MEIAIKIVLFVLDAFLTLMLLGLLGVIMKMLKSSDYMAEHSGNPRRGLDPHRLFIIAVFVAVIVRVWM